ncbi:MAG: GNAT family N-acetyltransferase [Acidobacteriia bacterium]|nr:GNAT family N-acetyltransferase [Terriglobia bacterium]
MAEKLEVMVDGQTRESWADILAQFEDANIYQTWAYGTVRWGSRNLSHLLVSKHGHILAAAQLRIARLPMLPAGIAYLRWGPLCQRKGQALDPVVVVDVVARLREEYCRRRRLTLQVIPNAYSGEARGNTYDWAFVRSALRPDPRGSRYRTVIVDLVPPAEVMRKRLDQKWRNQLNRSEKNGLVLEVSDSPEAYRTFVKLYEAMWVRKRFKTSVDVEEFHRILELLSGSARMQTFIAKTGGQPIAALVCSLLGDTAIYLLGATNEKARELKAAYFLQWQAMLWLKDRGACWYDLGGIDPQANPGGYHFKSGLRGSEVAQLPPYTCNGSWLSRAAASFINQHRRALNVLRSVPRSAAIV